MAHQYLFLIYYCIVPGIYPWSSNLSLIFTFIFSYSWCLLHPSLMNLVWIIIKIVLLIRRLIHLSLVLVWNIMTSIFVNWFFEVWVLINSSLRASELIRIHARFTYLRKYEVWIVCHFVCHLSKIKSLGWDRTSFKIHRKSCVWISIGLIYLLNKWFPPVWYNIKRIDWNRLIFTSLLKLHLPFSSSFLQTCIEIWCGLSVQLISIVCSFCLCLFLRFLTCIGNKHKMLRLCFFMSLSMRCYFVVLMHCA